MEIEDTIVTDRMEKKVKRILTKHIDPLKWVDEITKEICYLIEHGDEPEISQPFEPKPNEVESDIEL